jgi:hypothetical protein
LGRPRGAQIAKNNLLDVISRHYGDSYQTVDTGDYADQEGLWLPLRKQKLWHRAHLDISERYGYIWFGRFFDANYSDESLVKEIGSFVKIFEVGRRDRDQKIRKVTEAKRIQAFRLTQDEFRGAVMDLWANRCCISGKRTREVLRASHIVPWTLGTGRQQKEKENGLLLSADLDALFDKGLIAFDAQGRIVISTILDSEYEELGLNPSMKLQVQRLAAKKLSAKQKNYLRWHKENLFRP